MAIGGFSNCSDSCFSLSLLVRGRWAVESSGRHYIQSGRQLLLSMSLPASVAALARALRTIGVGALVEQDLRERVLAAS